MSSVQKNYNMKQERLKRLKEKASFKNPDEFYFGMIDKKKGPQYTQEALKLMKTQDIGYFTMKKTAETKKIEKLQDNLHLLSKEPINTHTIFVESKEEAENFDPIKYFNTIPEGLNRAYNRPRKEILETEDIFVNEARVTKVEKEKKKTYDELISRIEREKNLQTMVEKMYIQKQVMGKGRKTKISGKGGMPSTNGRKNVRSRIILYKSYNFL